MSCAWVVPSGAFPRMHVAPLGQIHDTGIGGSFMTTSSADSSDLVLPGVTTGVASRHRGRIFNLQALRAFAAFAVVFHHLFDYLNSYVGAGLFRIQTNVFAAGVDVFFVLSGFIMAETTSSSDCRTTHFLWMRILRVCPIYYLLTLVTAAALSLDVHLFGVRGFTFEHLLRSLAFLPYFEGGLLQEPLLFVGWTLNFEMFFYAVFALGLLARGVRSRFAAIIGILCFFFVARVISLNPYLRYWGNPMIFEFGAGIALWGIQRRFCWSRRGASVALVVACACLASTQILDVRTTYAWRVVLWGIPASLLVFSALSFERHGFRLRNAFVQLQGDASYALYLIHPFVLQACGKLSILLGLHGSIALALISAAMAFPFVILVGTLFHQYVERLLQFSLRGLFVRRPAIA